MLFTRAELKALVYNGGNMKCTGLKAVSYPDTQQLIKGNTVKISTNTRIFYIWCCVPLIILSCVNIVKTKQHYCRKMK